MKRFFKIIYFSVMTNCFFVSIAMAGGVDFRGGGHCVFSNNKVYLLDLYENNLAETKEEYYDFNEYVLPVSLPPWISWQTHHIVEKKLDLLAKNDPTAYVSVLSVLKNLKWQLVDRSLNFLPVNNSKNSSLCQIAVRENEIVKINGFLWAKMNFENQAALIIHELFSTLYYTYQVSPLETRKLVGDFFRNKVELSSVYLNAIWNDFFVWYTAVRQGASDITFHTLINQRAHVLDNYRKSSWYSYIQDDEALSIWASRIFYDLNDYYLVFNDGHISRSYICKKGQILPNNFSLFEVVAFVPDRKFPLYKTTYDEVLPQVDILPQKICENIQDLEHSVNWGKVE